jgi:prolipoprotein diacylglyceryl transferase
MFPKLSDLINYLFGSHLNLPVQTYGFFLAMAFLVAGFILRIELMRKEKEGLLQVQNKIVHPNQPTGWFEIITGVILSSVIGWKFFGIIFHYRDFANNPQQFLLSGKGSLAAIIVIAVISSGYHIYKRITLKKTKEEIQELIIHPYQYTWNIIVVGIIFAIIGSKLFDIIDNFSSFLQNPMHSLMSFRGLTFYGGFIVTVIALLLYMRVIKLDWKHVIDSAAPAIIIGYAVGRLGCHFSGDGCWGIVNINDQPSWLGWIPGWLWAFDFPHNVVNHGVPIPGCHGPNCMVLAQPVFPTSLYESLIALISFGVLWFLRLRIKAPVTLFGLFLILNGISRFFIEKIRINNKYEILYMMLSQAEIISVGLIIIGIVIIIYFSRKYRFLGIQK